MFLPQRKKSTEKGNKKMSSFIGKLENLKIVQKSVVVKKCPAIS